MRTQTQRPNLFRRLRAKGNDPEREYEASAIIQVGADTVSLGHDLAGRWTDIINDITGRFPWRDTVDGVEHKFGFEWDNQVFRTQAMPLLCNGQLRAFENWVEKLCQELLRVQTPKIKVYEATAVITFTKAVSAKNEGFD